jgi:Protein of unknown function (DUF3800)
MRVYFDESGDFNPSIPGQPKFCFVLGVIIPEIAEEALRVDFDWFLKQLGRTEHRQGEPKGSLLSIASRRVLLEILKSHKGVMLVPISVNLAYDSPEFFVTAPEKIRALIEGNLHLESSFMTVEARAELAKRVSRLSVPVLVRLVSYGIAVLKSIEAIVCRYSCDVFHSSYDSIELIFDRVVRTGGREELVFRDVLFGWIANWSRTTPIRIPPSLGESHPFLKLYGDKREDRWLLDLGKMLVGKIRFEESKHTWQIQLTDFMVSTWSETLADHGLQKGFHVLFRDLFRKNALPTETPLGVVAPTDRTEVVPAPSYLEVFARMAIGESKILPCA